MVILQRKYSTKQQRLQEGSDMTTNRKGAKEKFLKYVAIAYITPLDIHEVIMETLDRPQLVGSRNISRPASLSDQWFMVASYPTLPRN